MKILQLTNKIPYPPKDGGAIATLNLSKGLADLGHEVTILTMNTHKHYFDINKIPKSITDQISFHDVILNTEIKIKDGVYNLLFSKMPYNAERFISERYRIKLIELLKSKKFDIVQLEGLYLTPYIKDIRKHSNSLISFRAHNIEHEIWERIALQKKSILKRRYCKLISKRIKRLKKRIINEYDVLIPITQRDADKFNELGNKKPLHVVPFGIDSVKFIPKPETTTFPSLFHIGTLDWIPNQEGVLWFLKNVWPEILKLHPNLTFNIAGRNAPKWMETQFKNYENVNYLGEIDDAIKFINENAIMIVPLFSGSGMRVKIIEGMALGKAIITTPIGIEGIPATNNVNVIIQNNTIDFIEKIDNLIKNKQLFDDISKNAIKFVKENFDNRKISKDLAYFYYKQL